jgi:hypothetical protein
MSGEVTYSQVLGMRMWTSLGAIILPTTLCDLNVSKLFSLPDSRMSGVFSTLFRAYQKAGAEVFKEYMVIEHVRTQRQKQ